MAGRMLFTATAPHPCEPPPINKQNDGSVWQCSDCCQLWHFRGSWRVDHNPGVLLTITFEPNEHGVHRVAYSNNPDQTYGWLSARGRWADEHGYPVPTPGFADLPANPERKPRVFRAKRNVTPEEIAEFGETWKARHSNGVPDVQVFTENVEQVKWLRGLLAEDNDAKKTALGLIVLLIMVAAIVLTALALTGHLQ